MLLKEAKPTGSIGALDRGALTLSLEVEPSVERPREGIKGIFLLLVFTHQSQQLGGY